MCGEVYICEICEICGERIDTGSEKNDGTIIHRACAEIDAMARALVREHDRLLAEQKESRDE